MEKQVIELPLNDVFSDPNFNSRGSISPMDVIDLARSIEAHGLLQPIAVQPWSCPPWRIVYGHRRYAAFLLLRRSKIPAIIIDKLQEADAMVLNLAENMKRSDPDILQEAKAVARFEQFGWSEMRLARELNVPKNWVTVRRKLLKLPEVIQARAAAGFLTQHQIMDMANMMTEAEQTAYCRKCVDHKIKGERGSFSEEKERRKKERAARRDPRNISTILDMQEWIQDTLRDAAHPVAKALAWAAGIIPDEELKSCIRALQNDHPRH